MLVAINATLLLATLVIVLYPLWTKHGSTIVVAPPGAERRTALQAEKDAVYAAIRDLDFEYRTGKLSEEDYTSLRQDYRHRALALLKQYGDLEQTTEATPPCCAVCGHHNPCDSNFCESCGAGLHLSLACQKCGTTAASSDRYCAVCGNPL